MPARASAATPASTRVFEMVGRQSAEFGGERGAPAIGELIGMELHRQPLRARCGEHAARLSGGEADRLAERVDRVRKTGVRRLGNRLSAHALDIVVGASRILDRHGMRGEQRRAHVHADVAGHASRRVEAAGARLRCRARNPT